MVLEQSLESAFCEMADPPPSDYSKREVVQAGDVIARTSPLDQSLIDAYRTAHSWRNSCVHPMREVRRELTWRVKNVSPLGALTAGRLKRIQSIRSKLARSNISLYQMQDIAGCRAIVDGIQQLNELVSVYVNGTAYRTVSRNDDYISSPKVDGYRSHHLIMKFNGENDDARYARHFVEVQFRTKLQHAWATAVEAVGLFRNEDIKGGEGTSDWRRLFQIVASEFAVEEGCAIVPGTVDNGTERLRELTELVGTLDAVKTLDGIREAISFSGAVKSPDAKYYLVQYDYQRRKVNIVPYAYLPNGLADYETQEKKITVNSVFVEVDRVGDLKGAYPNYFLDVGLFAEKLRSLVSPTNPTFAPSKSGWRPNLDWLSGWRGRG